jgi:hypothetical protein
VACWIRVQLGQGKIPFFCTLMPTIGDVTADFDVPAAR